MTDYERYRGKCREVSEALVAVDPSLTLCRGHYYCPHWGEQPHWWCKTADGAIVDMTKDQFPSKGKGEYVEFNGWLACADCGVRVHEDEAFIDGNGRYAFCSSRCNYNFVM